MRQTRQTSQKATKFIEESEEEGAFLLKKQSKSTRTQKANTSAKKQPESSKKQELSAKKQEESTKKQEASEDEGAIIHKKQINNSRAQKANTSTKKQETPDKKPKRLKKMSDSEDYQPDAKDQRESDHQVDIADLSMSLSSFSQREENTDKKKTPRSQPRKRAPQKAKPKVKKQDSEDEDVQSNHQFFDQKVGNVEHLSHAEQILPYFIKEGHVKDEEGREPGEPNYDPSTLYIPIQDYQKLSPMFKQYWNAKKKNYDKVLFFRFGRWLHCFYRDAILIGQVCGAKNIGFWGKDRPVVTIYDSQYPIYVRGLLERGYQICLIEQIEKGEISQRDKGEIAKREVAQIISKGTWQDLDDDMSYESRFLMTIIEDQAPRNQKGYKYVYGIALVDSTTNEFFLDQFYDDEHSNNLRALLVKTKPIEVIVQHGSLNQETEKLIKNVCQPVFYYFTKEFKELTHIFNQFKQEFMEKADSHKQKEFEGILIPKQQVEPDFKVDPNINEGLYEAQVDDKDDMLEEASFNLSGDYPSILQELEKQYNFESDIHLKSIKKTLASLSIQELDEMQKINYSYYYSVQALYALQFYLRQLMLSITVYRRGIFSLIDTNFQKTNQLYLDSQALESLEIFQVNLQTKVQEKGSLFSYINKCGSNFGKRLLKKWLSEPLFNIQRLKERQDSVNDLVHHIALTDEFNKKVKTVPDFERSITKIFNSLQPQRLKVVSFTGDTFGQTRLKELSQLLKQLKQATSLVEIFHSISTKIKSKRLRRLIKIKKPEQEAKLIQKKAQPAKKNVKKSTQIEEEKIDLDEEMGLFPDINAALDELELCLEIKDGEATPRQGLSSEYDKAINAQLDIQNKLTHELNHYKKLLDCDKIVYYHGKLKYQIEVPDQYIENKKPKELTITSKKKGVQRFQSEKIEDLVYALKFQESEVNKSLIPFFEEYFQKFYSFKHLWLQLVACLQELDCLCALAIVSNAMETSCLPNFIQEDDEDIVGDEVFHLEGAIHPCLMEQMPNVKWVANDIIFKKDIDALLLTGPNMSGKSTLLRLTAIHIILAQIGCFVPAKSFTLRPFDRIFCRIGASDRLLEGKSTFFIEMEETKTILDQCTQRSLVIVDELGRGTSTYDGVAIASAVLRHLVTKLLPKTLFATHYHILLDEFALHKNIKNTVMKHYYDEDTQEVHFTYKLIEGHADKSFAANVARIAGLPRDVIKRAVEVENKITKEEDKLTVNREIVKSFNEAIKLIIDGKKIKS